MKKELKQVMKLKGGENSHLNAELLTEVGIDGKPLYGNPYAGGIDLGARARLPGWTNIGDISSVIRTAVNLGAIYEDSQEPHIAVSSKHTRPVAIAKGRTQEEAAIKAIAGDLNSPFGGVWGFNSPLTYETAQFIDRMFIEGVVAPVFEEGTADLLKDTSKVKAHRNRFLLEVGDELTPKIVNGKYSLTPAALGYHVKQDREPTFDASAECSVVTGNNGISDIESLDDALLNDIDFAGNAAIFLSSNLVFYVHNGAVAGLGDGCGARTVAAEKARNMLQNSAYAALSANDDELWDAVLFDTPFTREDFEGTIKTPIRLTAFSDAFYPKLDGFVETAGIDRVKRQFGERRVKYTEGKKRVTFIPKKDNFDPKYDKGLIPAVVVQPGGSLGDRVILPIAEKYKIKMVFTMDESTYKQYQEVGPGKGITGRRFFGHNIQI
ncbi:hypothetical protein ACFLZ7_03935 [Nanoarchaeota archaeon]